MKTRAATIKHARKLLLPGTEFYVHQFTGGVWSYASLDSPNGAFCQMAAVEGTATDEYGRTFTNVEIVVA